MCLRLIFRALFWDQGHRRIKFWTVIQSTSLGFPLSYLHTLHLLLILHHFTNNRNHYLFSFLSLNLRIVYCLAFLRLPAIWFFLSKCQKYLFFGFAFQKDQHLSTLEFSPKSHPQNRHYKTWTACLLALPPHSTFPYFEVTVLIFRSVLVVPLLQALIPDRVLSHIVL